MIIASSDKRFQLSWQLQQLSSGESIQQCLALLSGSDPAPEDVNENQQQRNTWKSQLYNNNENIDKNNSIIIGKVEQKSRR